MFTRSLLIVSAMSLCFSESMANAATYIAESSPHSTDERLPGTSTRRPVSIYFVIDATGSMGSNIGAIRATSRHLPTSSPHGAWT